ncbi:MAG: formylglycine-generating enzyme family protein, partial [Planctomycetes bacterium]|nr:formylglycine-generating enzyme family protein [Planctomycetota bacterium]
MAASEAALAAATDDQRREYEIRLATLRELSASRASAAGVAAEEAAIAALDDERAVLAARVAERRTFSFPDTRAGREARWWHANLTRLIDLLEQLQDDARGQLATGDDAVAPGHGWSVPRRLAFAERLAAEMAPGGSWHRRWVEAIEAIRAHDDYGGLELRPQMGLVPIGPDPRSGLWEFWHVLTGSEPRRGGNGALVLDEGVGAVLVLVPAGSFWRGASADPAAEHNRDPQGVPTEGPIRKVTLSAFLLSKYELSQGQWLRFTGANPSFYQPPLHLAPSLLHPVESVSYVVCARELERMGLTLPSEAQWEYACRAGTDTPWWTGPERESLRAANAINVADRAAKRAGATWNSVGDWPELDDGYGVHAPIGTFAPNPWGFCEVHGNVWEW